MSQYGRSFCSTCRCYTVHEDGKCVYSHREVEKLFRSVEASKDDLVHIRELNDGTFSLDIWWFSKCIGDKDDRGNALTYLDKMSLAQLEKVSWEISTYLLDRQMARVPQQGERKNE